MRALEQKGHGNAGNGKQRGNKLTSHRTVDNQPSLKSPAGIAEKKSCLYIPLPRKVTKRTSSITGVIKGHKEKPPIFKNKVGCFWPLRHSAVSFHIPPSSFSGYSKENVVHFTLCDLEIRKK